MTGFVWILFCEQSTVARTVSLKSTVKGRFGEQTYGYQGGKTGRRNSYGICDQHVHTALFKMDNQQGPTI